MAINPVSSAGSAIPPIQQPSSEARQAIEAKRTADQAAQASSVDEKRQAEQAQQDQRVQQEQQSKPIVNTQGQVTGQMLNEVA